MDNIKKFFKSVMEKCLFFLKNKKHLYIIPMYFILVSVLFILLANFIYERYLVPEETEQITMDFTGGTDEPFYEFNGETIVIDPGHGGHDPGASSVTGLTEDEIVYNVALQMQEKLESQGAEVILTREPDEFKTLDERNVDGDLFVALHSDAIEDSSISGFTVYYTYPNQQEFAENISSALDKYSYFYNRGVNQENFQVTWQLDYPGVLVELGYLSNALDDRIIADEEYQELMADALVEGIYNYLYE